MLGLKIRLLKTMKAKRNNEVVAEEKGQHAENQIRHFDAPLRK